MSDITQAAPVQAPTRDDFQRLLAWRIRLRQHTAWLETETARYGLTQQQFQLLVSVKGHPGGQLPTVTDLAGYMLLRPNSTIELVNRCEAAGWVRKVRDRSDRRVTRVDLTAQGQRCLAEMGPHLMARLRSLLAALTAVAES